MLSEQLIEILFCAKFRDKKNALKKTVTVYKEQKKKYDVNEYLTPETSMLCIPNNI